LIQYHLLVRGRRLVEWTLDLLDHPLTIRVAADVDDATGTRGQWQLPDEDQTRCPDADRLAVDDAVPDLWPHRRLPVDRGLFEEEIRTQDGLEAGGKRGREAGEAAVEVSQLPQLPEAGPVRGIGHGHVALVKEDVG
jgi:hypothetical protein